MTNTSKSFSTKDMVLVGVMAALIFAATMFLYIPITLPIGDPTMLKAANSLCLLAGLMLGPVRGGLAAGLGSMLFDLLNPIYVRSAPFTFVFFFTMAFVCGLVAHSGGTQAANKGRNLLGAVLGALSYCCLYLTKSYVGLILAGSNASAAMAGIVPKIFATSVNAVFAVVVSMVLFPMLRKIKVT